MVTIGRRFMWHERWLDYRGLAESLRHGRFLAFVSEFGHINDSSVRANGGQAPWMLWYIRATMREIGLPTAVLGGTYEWRLLNATLTHEIEDQVRYHERNRADAHRMDRLLHVCGAGCFVVTFLVLACFLAGFVFEHMFGDIAAVIQHNPTTWLGKHLILGKPWVVFWAAGLPALGAALAGIRVQGDFEASTQRSTRMITALASLEQDYRKAMGREIGLEETAEMLISTARIMSEDTAAWQELHGRKRLALPA
jgi:hypothetical protein